MATFTEVARVPKGLEWLWHPQVVGLYNSVLQGCENNSTTREAAAGALQNITAGDKRVSVESCPCQWAIQQPEQDAIGVTTYSNLSRLGTLSQHS